MLPSFKDIMKKFLSVWLTLNPEHKLCFKGNCLFYRNKMWHVIFDGNELIVEDFEEAFVLFYGGEYDG